jgi:predicted phage gp36 major capsid-like protein
MYSLGIKPEALGSACWRDSVATFVVNNETKPVLNKLKTNNGKGKNYI